MADSERDRGNTSTQGADWEVVSLTASTYAACPGPKDFEPPVESIEETQKEQLVSSEMFMSGHFTFPPYEHKRLLIEPDCSEIHGELGSQDVKLSDEGLSAVTEADIARWNLKSDDKLHGIQFFNEGETLSDHGMEFGEAKSLEGLTMVGKESDVHAEYALNAFHAGISHHVFYDEGSTISESNEVSHHNPEYPPDLTSVSELNKERESDESGLPCQAWWKRHAISIYSHAKEASTFWSLCVAAVMGFMILGQQWQREKLQLHQLKWFTVNDESFNWMLGPISRFRDIMVRGHRPSLPLLRGGIASNR